MKTDSMADAGGKQGLFAGGLWSLIGRSVSAVMALAFSAIAARWLAPDQFGMFVLALSVSTVLATVATLGLNQGLVRVVAGAIASDTPDRGRWAVKQTLVLTVGSALILASLTAMLAPRITSFGSGAAVFVALWIIVRALQLVLGAAFRGMRDLRTASLIDNALGAVLATALLLAVSLVSNQPSFELVLVVIVASIGVTIVGGLFALRRFVAVDRNGKGETKDLLSLGLPLLLTSLMFFCLSDFHVWLLASFQPVSEVAEYGAAQQLVRFISFPLLVVNSAIAPFVASLHARADFSGLERLLRMSATIVAVPSLLIVGVLVAVPYTVLATVFGDSYREAAGPLLLLSLGHTINVLTGSPGVLLAMTGRQNQLMYFSLIAGIVAVSISALTIPRLGAVGAALGAAAGLATHNGIMWLYSQRHLGLRTHVGWSGATDFWWRLRRYVSVRSEHSAVARLLDNQVDQLQRSWWRFRGLVVADAFGDSHAQIFTDMNRPEFRLSNVRFSVCSITGATAFGLANPNSKTNALQIFAAKLKTLPANSPLLFMLGEVDVGFLIHLRAKKQKRPVKDALHEAIQNYSAFLEEYTSRFDSVAICSAPLPTISDTDRVGDVANLRREVEASQSARTELTLYYNDLLRRWCQRHKRSFVDLDPLSLDQRTRLVRKELLGTDATDHHYDREAFCNILRQALLATAWTSPQISVESS